MNSPIPRLKTELGRVRSTISLCIVSPLPRLGMSRRSWAGCGQLYFCVLTSPLPRLVMSRRSWAGWGQLSPGVRRSRTGRSGAGWTRGQPRGWLPAACGTPATRRSGEKDYNVAIFRTYWIDRIQGLQFLDKKTWIIISNPDKSCIKEVR